MNRAPAANDSTRQVVVVVVAANDSPRLKLSLLGLRGMMVWFVVAGARSTRRPTLPVFRFCGWIRHRMAVAPPPLCGAVSCDAEKEQLPSAGSPMTNNSQKICIFIYIPYGVLSTTGTLRPSRLHGPVLIRSSPQGMADGQTDGRTDGNPTVSCSRDDSFRFVRSVGFSVSSSHVARCHGCG